jgi:hypothetical protein
LALARHLLSFELNRRICTKDATGRRHAGVRRQLNESTGKKQNRYVPNDGELVSRL